MSGFEIAGIALAVLPMAFKAFGVYKEYFPSSKRIEEDLKQLAQDVSTEILRLHNTYALLLDPIQAKHENITVEELLEDPGSAKWRELRPEIDAQLRTILGASYDLFQEHRYRIEKCSEKLRVKLKLPDPRVDPTYREVKAPFRT